MFFPSTAEATALAKTGKVRLLAITSDARFESLPDVPTTKELGFADFTPQLWYAFLAPAGTPPAIVSKLHDAFAAALKDPALGARLTELGFTPAIRGPEALATYMKQEATRGGRVILDNGITAGN